MAVPADENHLSRKALKSLESEKAATIDVENDDAWAAVRYAQRRE
jgi:hypothetical protein